MEETRIVSVSLGEIIECRNMDAFNDLMESLFFAEDSEEERGFLSDIQYEVLGAAYSRHNMIEIAVSALVEKFDDNGGTYAVYAAE